MARRLSDVAEVTITEAARLLGVTRQRVHQLIKAGKLAARQVSQPQGTRLWLIKRTAVEKHARRTNGAPPMPAPRSSTAEALRLAEELNRLLPITETGQPYPKRTPRAPKDILRELRQTFKVIDAHARQVHLPPDLSEHLDEYLYGGRGDDESD